MLFKIVVGKQTRMFNCEQGLTVELLNSYIRKAFPKLQQFSLYYIDEEGDQIMLETQQDIAVYLELGIKFPKIQVKQLQPQKEMFDFTSHLHSKRSENQNQPQKTQKLEDSPILLKQEKTQIQEDKIILLKEDQTQELKIEFEKQDPSILEKKQQKKSLIHEVKCDECGKEPIEGIRYKCSQCQNFDQCEKCHEVSLHNESHPFIKIRDPKCVPISVKVSLGPQKISQKQQKQRVDRFSMLMSNREKNIDTKIVYETQEEKRIIIISLLESLFGTDVPNIYEQFAKQATQQTEQAILQSYLKYFDSKYRQNDDFTLFKWAKKTLSHLKEEITKRIVFSSD